MSENRKIFAITKLHHTESENKVELFILKT